jgi:imidazoleglycerol phosphate synthase glutamine amidotransferase subunit HisH
MVIIADSPLKSIDSGLLPIVSRLVLQDEIPIISICLGMQLFFESGEEGEMHGLDWIPEYVKRFNFNERGRFRA